MVGGASVGLPAETKVGEGRIVLDPAGVAAVVRAGHPVLVQSGAGVGAGFGDADYKEAGGRIMPDAAEAWAADVVVKVKEPQPHEYRFFRRTSPCSPTSTSPPCQTSPKRWLTPGSPRTRSRR